MASWSWEKRGKGSGSGSGSERGEAASKVVLDGSDIEELVGNKEAFSCYVDHKFQELDRDRDGKLSVKELDPPSPTSVPPSGCCLLYTSPSPRDS